jgi:hypothetical protein
MKSSRYLITTALLGVEDAKECVNHHAKMSELPVDKLPPYSNDDEENWFKNIKSFDEKEELNSEQLMIGFKFFNMYKHDQDDIEALRYACNAGDYAALYTLSNYLVDLLDNPSLNNEERKNYTAQLYEYLDRACQLYWSAGFLLASNALYNLYEVYRELGRPNNQEMLAQADKIYEEYLVCFLQAKLLIRDTYSNDIMSTLQKYIHTEDESDDKNQDESHHQFSEAKWKKLTEKHMSRFQQREDQEDLIMRSLNELKPHINIKK